MIQSGEQGGRGGQLVEMNTFIADLRCLVVRGLCCLAIVNSVVAQSMGEDAQKQDAESIREDFLRRLGQIHRGMSKEEAEGVLGQQHVERVERVEASIKALRDVRAVIYYDWQPIDIWSLGNVHLREPENGPDVPEWKRELLGDKYFQNVVAVSMSSGYSSDADLRHLEELASIKLLLLRGHKFTDKGIDSILHLKSLTDIDLRHTAVTDDGVAKLKALESLEFLDLRGLEITGSGLTALQHFTNLKQILLDATDVTDEAVPYLLRCKLLEHIGLQGTKISDNGRERLKQGLPRVYID